MLLEISLIRSMFRLLLTHFQCLATYTNLFMILIDQHFSHDTSIRVSSMINRESESCSNRFAYLEHHSSDEMRLFCELLSLLFALRLIAAWFSRTRHSFRSFKSKHQTLVRLRLSHWNQSSHSKPWRSFAKSSSSRYREFRIWLWHTRDEASRDSVRSFLLNDETRSIRFSSLFSYWLHIA
jgi:hypothetical protein